MIQLTTQFSTRFYLAKVGRLWALVDSAVDPRGGVDSTVGREGWEVSDFIRTLVVLSAIASWIGLRREENVARLMGLAALKGASVAMARVIHVPDRSDTMRHEEAERLKS